MFVCELSGLSQPKESTAQPLAPQYRAARNSVRGAMRLANAMHCLSCEVQSGKLQRLATEVDLAKSVLEDVVKYILA
jgi:hypothetical protein